MTEAEINQQAKIAKNEYYKAWRAKNKDKVKEANARYWKKRAEEARENHTTEREE